MKKASMKASLPSNLQHAVKMIERNGHKVHIKNQIEDASGNTRYYFTLLKQRQPGKKSPFAYAKRTFASVYGAIVEVGKHHDVAGVLKDSLVKPIPRHHCQRMTVIM